MQFPVGVHYEGGGGVQLEGARDVAQHILRQAVEVQPLVHLHFVSPTAIAGPKAPGSGSEVSLLVFFDLALELVALEPGVGPYTGQVFGSECRVAEQGAGLDRPRLPGGLQDPDRDPRLDDAGRAFADARRRFAALKSSLMTFSVAAQGTRA